MKKISLHTIEVKLFPFKSIELNVYGRFLLGNPVTRINSISFYNCALRSPVHRYPLLAFIVLLEYDVNTRNFFDKA